VYVGITADLFHAEEVVVHVFVPQRCFYFHRHRLIAVFQKAVNFRIEVVFSGGPLDGGYPVKGKTHLFEFLGKP
jgi:hypothetical protein